MPSHFWNIIFLLQVVSVGKPFGDLPNLLAVCSTDRIRYWFLNKSRTSLKITFFWGFSNLLLLEKHWLLRYASIDFALDTETLEMFLSGNLLRSMQSVVQIQSSSAAVRWWATQWPFCLKFCSLGFKRQAKKTAF